MKVMNRIKGFFSALVPVFVYLAVQFTIGLLATLTVLAVEMTRNPAIPETAPYRSSLLIVLVSNLVAIIVAFVEMKVQKITVKDIFSVSQNKIVYVFTVLFAIGVVFVFWSVSQLISPLVDYMSIYTSKEISCINIVFTFIAYMASSFADEIVFRGIAYKTFENRFPIWLEAIVTSLLFAFWHNDYSICFAFLMSMSLIFLRHRFKDLKLCLLANLIMTEWFAFSLFMELEWENHLLMIIVGSVLSVPSMLLMCKFSKKSEQISDKS